MQEVSTMAPLSDLHHKISISQQCSVSRHKLKERATKNSISLLNRLEFCLNTELLLLFFLPFPYVSFISTNELKCPD